MNLFELSQAIQSGQFLNKNSIKEMLSLLLNDSIPTQDKVNFLITLTAREESAEEIAFLALALRDLAKPFPVPDEIRKEGFIDLCGTGGDGHNTFNVSTCSSFVIAAAGAKVVKHGNRGMTSKSGGFDVLETLGVNFNDSPQHSIATLEKTNLCFVFAQYYHPAFKKLAPLRREVAQHGSRTIFNLIGPLLNPTHPPFQMIGVPNLNLPEKYIHALSKMGIQRGAVVCGKTETGDPMDELSVLGETIWWEWNQNKFKSFTISPQSFSFHAGKSQELEVQSAQHSADIITHILKGEDKTIRRDIVTLNAGAGLFLMDKVKSLEVGVDLAAEILDSGKAWKKLQQVLEVTTHLKD